MYMGDQDRTRLGELVEDCQALLLDTSEPEEVSILAEGVRYHARFVLLRGGGNYSGSSDG